jgi:PAS domain S-box-containing protein
MDLPTDGDPVLDASLGEARAWLNGVFMQAPIAIAIVRGPRFVIELANPSALRVWGRSDLSEVLGRPLFEALPEGAGQGFEELLERVRTTGEPYVGRELPMLLKASAGGQPELCYFDFVYEPLRVAGVHDSIISVGTDVTESVLLRQRMSRDALAELRANEERLRRVMEASGAGSWEMSVATRSIYADSRLAELFGLNGAGDHSLAAFAEHIAYEGRAPAFEAIETALQVSDGSFCVEVQTLAPAGGRARWLEWRGRLEAHESGARFAGTAVDITARKVAELERERLHAEMARERHRLYAQLMQAPVAVSIMTGPDLVYELANDRALQIAGRRDVVGKSLREVFPELPADAPAVAVLRGVYESGEPFSADEYLIPIDRAGNGVVEDVYFQFSCVPFRDAVTGNVTSIMSVAVDVTAQVLARRRIESLLEALRLADQRKDEFLATLAHELRNPMAAISTALTLLEQNHGDAERTAKYRQTAQRQMSNLVRLVDDLLDVARITRGNIELRKADIDLAAVVDHALAAVRPAAEARGQQLTVTLAPGEFPMHADATRLEQVVVNVLTNAVKYSERGGKIALHLERQADGGAPRAVLRVRDDGRGIPPDMLENVFDPFTQVSPAIDRGTGGLGLGLTLVRRLVAMHGGEVVALSDGPGHGSEFVIRLPLWTAQSQNERLAAPAARNGRAAQARRRVLVIEDGEDLRELLRELLERLGHEVFVASDGLEATQRVLAIQPDVALIDVGLPYVDGYEIARRVRAQVSAPQPLLVALTGYGGAEVAERARKAGFDLHVTKPIDAEGLRELLART